MSANQTTTRMSRRTLTAVLSASLSIPKTPRRSIARARA
jgi:hypothetical protein